MIWRQRKGCALEHRFQNSLKQLGILLKISLSNNDRIAEEREFGLVQVDERGKAALVKRPREHTVEHRGVYGPGSQRLGHHDLIADRQDADLIAVRIESQMFQREQSAHPHRAADGLNAKALVLQILRGLDTGFDDQLVGDTVIQSRKNFEIRPRSDRSDDRRAAGITDVDFTGSHSRNQCRCATNEYRVGVKTILEKEAAIMGDPQCRYPGIHRSVGDHDFARRGSTLGSQGKTANTEDRYKS